jgi:mono/diheme cytochrome c family protein
MVRLLAIVGAIAILFAVAAGVFFFGGYFDIAARDAFPAFLDQAIARVRDASIDRHAVDRPPAALDDPKLVQSGARAFSERGCVFCHGAPGVQWKKFSEGMRPDPPDLKDVVKDTSPHEIFWVVKNGIKMTGMPSFGEIGVPDEEIWSIVAFVEKIPTVSEEDFRAWTQAEAAK